MDLAGYLVTGQIPHSVDFVVHLLLGQQPELLVLDERASQLQVAVHLGRLIGPGQGEKCPPRLTSVR